MITNKVQAIFSIGEQQNPFPGLRAFSVEESHLFFGREGQSEIILEYLARNHFAAVTGASGSGKSSLIYCGLIPILFGGFVSGAGSNWRIIATRPGNQPVRNLAEAIADAETQEFQDADQKTETYRNLVYALLRRNSFGLVEAVSQMKLGKGENLLLVIDQFEELFRFKESRDDAVTTLNETEAFIKLLVNAVRQRKLPIYVVLTMRSDFVGECSQFQELTALINDSNYLVPQMTRDDFSRAIIGPIAVKGVEMDSQLYQEILNSISEGSDQLPVLQHVMMRTWEFWKKYNEPGTALRLRDYEAAGKMENALSMHANEAFEALTEEGKRICKSMFRTLTEKSTDNKGIRHPATIKEIADVAQAQIDEVIKVINEFRSRGRSFVTPSENIELNEYTVIDISHESLMRVWDRLKGWVEEETNSVQMYLRLSEAASLYQLGKTSLWRPPDLQLALNWKKTQLPSLAWAKKYNPAFEKVMVFLDASEKKFLQEEQNKIKLQRRTLNRTRRFASVMGFTAIIFLLLTAFAISQWGEAQKQKKRAEVYASIMEQQKNIAVEEKDVKELERLRAMVEKDSAERSQMSALLRLSEVRVEAQEANEKVDEVIQQSEVLQKTSEQARLEMELAERTAKKALEEQSRAEQATSQEKRTRMLTTAQTMAIKAIQTENKDLKGLLAYQAYKFNEQYNGPENNPDVYKGLYSVMSNFNGKDYNSLKGHEGSVKSLIFIPTQNIVFSSGADGNIIRWDLNQSAKKGTTLIHNNFSNRSLAVSSGGRWLACGTGTSIIQVFNLNQPNTAPELFEAHKGAVVDLDFISGKDILISVGSDKTIVSWNLLTGEKKNILTHTSRIRTICLSKDGLYVYGGTDDGKLIRWTISNGEAKELYDNKQQAINALFMNSTGSRMAIGDITGNIIIIDPVGSKRIAQVKGHSARIQDIAYSPDNTQLATSSFDGTIRIWNAGKLSENPVLITEHESWALAIAFSPDGKTLVSSSEKGVIYYWPTKAKSMAQQVCNNVSRNFTEQEWDIYVGMDIEYQKTCSNRE
jgi:WD40 repeat protein